MAENIASQPTYGDRSLSPLCRIGSFTFRLPYRRKMVMRRLGASHHMPRLSNAHCGGGFFRQGRFKGVWREGADNSVVWVEKTGHQRRGQQPQQDFRKGRTYKARLLDTVVYEGMV